MDSFGFVDTFGSEVHQRIPSTSTQVKLFPEFALGFPFQHRRLTLVKRFEEFPLSFPFQHRRSYNNFIDCN